jgi:hypothetical protein
MAAARTLSPIPERLAAATSERGDVWTGGPRRAANFCFGVANESARGASTGASPVPTPAAIRDVGGARRAIPS